MNDELVVPWQKIGRRLFDMLVNQMIVVFTVA